MTNKKMSLIRKIYLYLFSLIGLVLVVIGCVELVNLGLKAYIFTAADQYYSYPVAAPAEPSARALQRRPPRGRPMPKCRHIRINRRKASAKAQPPMRLP